MKKRILAAAALCLTLVLCLGVVRPNRQAHAATADGFFTAAAMEQALTEFLGSGADNRIDRTSFSDAEKTAANWLNAKLTEYDSLHVEKSAFTYAEKYNSYNIEARYTGADSRYQVIIGANYDNMYENVGNLKGNKGAGALQNATGVSVLLEIARYLQETKPVYPFDVVLVFFGASEPGLIGSRDYVNKMTTDSRLNTLLMANVQRVGGDRLYVYDDEVKTLHGKLLLDTASERGLSFRRQPTSVPYIAAETVQGIPYTTWGMLGDQAGFMSSGINTVNVFGGHIGSFNLNNAETLGGNISYTAKDNLDTLKSRYPDYSRQMADIADMLTATIAREDFTDTCLRSPTEKYDYTWLTKPVYVSIILVGMMILAGVALILLVKHFEKKYPFVPVHKKLKIAVFGIDYEDKDTNDIFVDVKPTGRSNNPFDGY